MGSPPPTIEGMWSSEVVGEGGAPPVWRSLLYCLLVFLGSTVSFAFSPTALAAQAGSNWGVLVSLAGFLVTLGACVALFWRHRFPFVLAVASALVPLALPIGNTLAFVALAALLGRRRGPATWWAAGLTGLTSVVVVLRDAAASPNGASLLKTVFAPRGAAESADTPAPVLAVVVFAALGIALAVGAGLLVRAGRVSRAATEDVAEERQISTRLGDEVARSAERERIAREVHDVMGHRLSIIALHAGVLESASRASTGADPRVSESAHLVRESAVAAVDDLHSLLDLLREPAGSEPPSLPLTELPRVVAESVQAGQVIASSIFIQDAEAADPNLSRAVHRIVQEILTNARKHAPGQTVTLTVTGSPADGIVIDATNPLPTGATSSPQGALRGLAGLAERVELVGGTLRHGVDRGGSVFHVHATLPWRVR